MEWSNSKLMTLRQCHRKFYFAQELADHHFTYPVRRKAFELGQSKSLRMWQGSLIDNAFSKTIVSLYKNKQTPDFAAIADEVVELAKRQFEFSRARRYHEKGISKKKAGDDFLILDVHEAGTPYQEQDVLAIYSTVRDIILRMEHYPSPEKGKTLHQYMAESGYLQPNIQYWRYEFLGITLNPQIDLVRKKGQSVHIIDWKVAESNTSDYSNQLYLAGIVAYHNIKKDCKAKGWTPPRMELFELFEINLLNGNITAHPFTKETTAAALDRVYQFRDEQEQLSGNRKWNELDIREYARTDKKETCMFCKYKPLCIHLIQNNFTYDEQEYNKLVQADQLERV